MRRYEAMFLFDNNVAHDWPRVEQEVRRLCERIGATLLTCNKFDERKLAYEIKGRKRGTYVLTYFDAPPDRIADLERDAGLSELILRCLVLRADHVSEQRISELRARPAESALMPLVGEGRRSEEHPRPRREASERMEPGAEEALDGGSQREVGARSRPAGLAGARAAGESA